MWIRIVRVFLAILVPGLIPAYQLRYRQTCVLLSLLFLSVLTACLSLVFLSFFSVVLLAMSWIFFLATYLYSAVDAFRSDSGWRPNAKRLGTAGVALLIAGITLYLTFWFREYIAEPFLMPGASMTPTLIPGDSFIVDKRFSTAQIRRGDLVIHRADNIGYVKRVVAVGGDIVRYHKGEFFLNGQKVIHAPYTGSLPECQNIQDREQTCYVETLDAKAHLVLTDLIRRGSFEESTTPTDWKVPDGHVFLLGDARDNSLDSRLKGPISLDSIIGRPVFIRTSFNPESWRFRWHRMGTALR